MHAFIVLTTENYKKKNRIEIERAYPPAFPRKRKNRIRNNEIFSLQPHTRREEKRRRRFDTLSLLENERKTGKKSSIQTNDLHSSFEKPPSCPLFPSSKAVASTPPIGCVQFDDARDDKKTITEDGIVNGRANQYWIFIAFSSKLHHVLLTRFSQELKSFLVKKEPRGMGKRGAGDPGSISWWQTVLVF